MDTNEEIILSTFETEKLFGKIFIVFSVLVFAGAAIAVCIVGGLELRTFIRAGRTLAGILWFLIFYMPVAIFPLALAIAWGSLFFSRFQLSEDGLGVKRPLSRWEYTRWNDFQQICICYTAYSTRGPLRANTVLCCVKKGEKKNLYGRWKTENPFHQRGVITFGGRYVEPDLVLKMQLYCSARIDDLRGYGNYRHPENIRHDIKLKTPEELQQIREAMQKADTEK